MSITPVVFCAVKAVIALMAYTPLVIIVLISAWMPAPPLESLPAIVNAVLMFFLLFHCALIFLGDARWCPQSAARLPVLQVLQNFGSVLHALKIEFCFLFDFFGISCTILIIDTYGMKSCLFRCLNGIEHILKDIGFF